MWWCAAAETSAALMPGQTVSVRYRPQKAGAPTEAETWGRSPSAPLGLPVKALQESTPQRMRVGCIAAERACMSMSEVGPCTLRRSWPSVELALTGGTAPMTASKDGVSLD